MRKKELNLDLLQYWGLVSRWVVKTTDLNRADLDLMLYLNGLKYFTRPQFKEGELLYSWDTRRWNRLRKNDEWITRLEIIKKQGHYKYALSVKAKQLLKRMIRILEGREDLPESRRNKLMKGKNHYAEAIKKFNRKKD